MGGRVPYHLCFVLLASACLRWNNWNCNCNPWRRLLTNRRPLNKELPPVESQLEAVLCFHELSRHAHNALMSPEKQNRLRVRFAAKPTHLKHPKSAVREWCPALHPHCLQARSNDPFCDPAATTLSRTNATSHDQVTCPPFREPHPDAVPEY